MSTNATFQKHWRFHFQGFWTKMPGFQEVVATAWAEQVHGSNRISWFHQRLAHTARALRRWSAKKIGNIREQILLAKEVIFRLDAAMGVRTLSVEERWLRADLKRKLLGLSSLQRTIARQKSRIVQINEGDANTAFFHRQAAGRQKRNAIFRLRRGNETFSEASMESAAYDHFRLGLGLPVTRDASINLDLLDLPTVDLLELEDTPTEEDIWNAIKALPRDKAPGPDGFTTQFYQHCWPLIKHSFMEAVQQFCTGDNRNFHLLNRAFITLLPKRADAAEITDYRPVSLIHSFAKILEKALANKLAPRLDELIARNQSAFISGRCIQDNFALVQLAIKALHRSRTPALFLKLDIAKAFDSVAWQFLLEVLARRGFGPRWRYWITSILASSSTQILINGLPGNNIWHAQGLRQGSPISPMLFIIVIDVLSALMAKVENVGLLESFLTAGIRHRLSLFADDMVMFIRPRRIELKVIASLLQMFGRASGLLVNLGKSSIIPIRCGPEIDQAFVEDLPCVIGSFPCTYLGLPLGPGSLRKEDLQKMIDGVANHLPAWKGRLLYEGGRITWIKSVLTATSVYQMLSFDLPPWVIHKIEEICRDFLWKGMDQATSGDCKVAWDLVCRPTKYGGLGIHNLRLLNAALRARWLWISKTDSSRPWQGLTCSVSNLAEGVFQASTTCKIGDGRLAVFWTDRWIDGCSPRDLAPDLYEATRPAARLMSVREGLDNGRWITNLTGNFSARMIFQFCNLWVAVQRTRSSMTDTHDSFRWTWTESGLYSARTAYMAFFEGTTGMPGAEQLWTSRAPLRLKFFGWLALFNRCWTADRLQAHGLQHQPTCPLCSQVPESLNHLLLQCPFARTVWYNVMQELHLNVDCPTNDSILVNWWERTHEHTPVAKRKEINALINQVMFTIWKERNSRTFEQVQETEAKVTEKIIAEWRLWLLAWRTKRHTVVPAGRHEM